MPSWLHFTAQEPSCFFQPRSATNEPKLSGVWGAISFPGAHEKL